MTKVTLPSGTVVQHHGPAPENLADFCPRREEHTLPMSRRTGTVAIHEPCGLPVIWTRKRGRR